MNNIGNKQLKIKRGLKIFLWALTSLSFFFFIYKIFVFSSSVYSYDFELDEEIKPTASMIASYSVGAFVGTLIIPLLGWFTYGLFYYFKSERYKKLKANKTKTVSIQKKVELQPQNFTSKFLEISKKINPRTKKLIGFIWVIFHLFMLLTSENIFNYKISWEDFWIFNDWENYQYRGYGSHYDIFEFIIYVIIPVIVIFGRKYLRNESIFANENIKLTKTSTVDDKINDLKKYKELFDLGVISEEEFAEIKKKLL